MCGCVGASAASDVCRGQRCGRVRERDVGVARDGAREREALLLAAGKLTGIMRQPVAEPDKPQFLFRPLEGVLPAGKFERDRDILECGHGGDEVEGLEHDPYMIATEAGEIVFAEAREFLARAGDAAGTRALEPRENHEKGGLAGTGRPDKTGGFTPRDRQIDALENVDRTGRARQAQFDAVEFDDLLGDRIGQTLGSFSG